MQVASIFAARAKTKTIQIVAITSLHAAFISSLRFAYGNARVGKYVTL